jgi:hypothetical protein
MTHLDLLSDVAHERRDEFHRQADARRLAAAVRATRGRQEPDSDPVRWLRRFASSLHGRQAAQAKSGA